MCICILITPSGNDSKMSIKSKVSEKTDKLWWNSWLSNLKFFGVSASCVSVVVKKIFSSYINKLKKAT